MSEVPGSVLPSFAEPPVAEVSLTVQFERLAGFRLSYVGLFLDALDIEGQRFVRVTEDWPDEPVVETFGSPLDRPRYEVRLVDAPIAAQALAETKDGGFRLSLQADRLSFQWRRPETPDTAYPRFPQIAHRFAQVFAAFREFVDTRGLGEVSITQAEVGYVNRLVAGMGWSTPSELSKVVRMWKPVTGGRLPPLEDAHFAQRHLLSDDTGPYARLYITLDTQPGRHGTTDLRLALTFRGKPRTQGDDELMMFLEEGHSTIVWGFTEVTTSAMHEVWRRER